MATARSKLPSSAFVYPKSRKYPINTIGRARSALSRASSSRNSGSYRTVAKAVRARYGNRVATVGAKRGNLTTPGLRGRSR